MRGIGLCVLTLLVVVGTAAAQGNPETDFAAFAAASPGTPPVAASPGPLPGAGTVLATFANLPPSAASNYHISLGWDAKRSVMWIGNEMTAAAPLGSINLFMVEPATRAVLTSMSVDGVRCGMAPNQVYGRSVNGVAALCDGTLLIDDFQGDLAITEDPLMQWDPVSRQVVSNWYLDSTQCAACPRATGPLINGVIGHTVRNTSVPGAQEIFLPAALASGTNPANFYYQLNLTPGCPGTHSIVRMVPPPFAGAIDAIGYDPVLSSFWHTDRTAANNIHETKFNAATGVWTTLQTFPVANPANIKFGIAANGNSGGDSGPYEIWAVRATGNVNSVINSGHQGHGIAADIAPVAGGTDLLITEDQQNAGASYIAAASFTSNPAGWITLDCERMIPLNIDSLFFLTLAGGGGLFGNLIGNFDAARQARIRFVGHPALIGLFLNFNLSYIVLDPNPNHALLGIRTVGPAISWGCMTEQNQKRHDYIVAAGPFWAAGNAGRTTVKILGKHNNQPVPWTAVVQDNPPKQVPSTINPAAGMTPATPVVAFGFPNNPGDTTTVIVTFNPPNQQPRRLTLTLRKD